MLRQKDVLKTFHHLIAQLFYNLISNGLKFRKPNIQPEIKISWKVVPEAADPQKQLLEISFEDNGVGFDEQYADKLFHIFQKMSTHTTGTGIGLATSKKICTLHGGTLTAKSKGADGSIFIATVSTR